MGRPPLSAVITRSIQDGGTPKRREASSMCERQAAVELAAAGTGAANEVAIPIAVAREKILSAPTATGPRRRGDRKSVVEGKRVSCRVARGGRRTMKKEEENTQQTEKKMMSRKKLE